MAKLNIIDFNGKKVKEITTDLFDGIIRKDIIQKIVETQKTRQPYAPYLWAGMETSASGNAKHLRHAWKSDRGKGMARIPKKRMSDKGDRFVWVGAVVPGTRGGRRAHPPKLNRKVLTINKKEMKLGLKSALALISSEKELQNKYSSLLNQKISIQLPIIFDSSILKLKSKEFFKGLKETLKENVYDITLQKKEIRAGKGKKRNRRYKNNAGMLLVLGNNQKAKIPGIEIMNAKDLKVINLASNGARLTAFTEEAVKDIEKIIK